MLPFAHCGVVTLRARSSRPAALHRVNKSRDQKVKVSVEKQFGEFLLVLETGELAKQASAAVVSRYGDTMVLNAVTSEPFDSDQDFFPLTCDYRERTAAAGK